VSVLSGRGLCDELITRTQEFYRLWCVRCVWSRNLVNGEAMAQWGLLCQIKDSSHILKIVQFPFINRQTFDS